ncbi:MAG: fimbrillin family protein [Bacteroidaceae bacterium]|nr:fimbrillin family protein [Bacteroidaceae bacterium]
MKKSYLMIAAAVALFTACSETDTFKDAVSENNPQPLSFSAYAGKNTKAKGENSQNLQDFYEAFSVYGFKSVKRTVNNQDQVVAEDVFDNDAVEYFGEDKNGTTIFKTALPSTEWVRPNAQFTAGWYYENVRFWDKMAESYEFFAVAPYVESGEYAVEAGDNNVKIKTAASPYVISTEKNLAIVNEVPKSQNLSYCGFNRDYMVASKITKTKASNALTGEVDLEFKHILAKLNIKIKLGDSYIGSQELVVNELKVNGLYKQGYYVGQTDLSGWNIDENEKYARDIDADYSLTAQTNYSDYYWLETLMFPQTATCKVTGIQPTATGMDDMYLYINYHIGTENYEAYYDFAAIWKANAAVNDTFSFAQGNEYNLTITVGPEPIQFDASVSAWDTTNNQAISM